MTTAEMESLKCLEEKEMWFNMTDNVLKIEMNYMKLLRICLVSSLILELAKLMQEQYRAAQAHHFNWISLICIIRTLIKQNIVEIKRSRLLSSSTRTCWKPYPTHSYNRESSLLHFDSGWKPMPCNFVKSTKKKSHWINCN
jgi:hypothetical protein